jgi:Universal stress protein UspA and related nucleotide-binding proteins
MATTRQSIEDREVEKVKSVHALRRILVHVSRDDRARSRIELAFQLAIRFSAKLTGIYLMTTGVPAAIAAAEVPPSFYVELEKRVEEDAETARRRYLDRAAQANVTSAWCCERGGIDSMLRLARYMDVTVVGQIDPEAADGSALVLPEDIALGSGRPVLAVPYIGAPADTGSRIVIAWNASREAARAVADALPFLQQAEVVSVVSIDERRGESEERSRSAADLCGYLEDHGVVAKPQLLYADTLSAADALLSYIADVGANLLVMGCYGHTRLREFVLGGMTRDILRHMTVPVLLSH